MLQRLSGHNRMDNRRAVVRTLPVADFAGTVDNRRDSSAGIRRVGVGSLAGVVDTGCRLRKGRRLVEVHRNLVGKTLLVILFCVLYSATTYLY